MFCNYCGTELKDDSVFCNKCGRKIGVESKLDLKPQKPVCPICGSELLEGEAACSVCGHKTGIVSAPVSAPVTEPVSEPTATIPTPMAAPVSEPAATIPTPMAAPVSAPTATIPTPMAEPVSAPTAAFNENSAKNTIFKKLTPLRIIGIILMVASTVYPYFLDIYSEDQFGLMFLCLPVGLIFLIIQAELDKKNNPTEQKGTGALSVILSSCSIILWVIGFFWFAFFGIPNCLGAFLAAIGIMKSPPKTKYGIMAKIIGVLGYLAAIVLSIMVMIRLFEYY